MNKIIFLTGSIIVFLCSCSVLLKRIYKIDKKFSFETRNEYLQYIRKNGNLDINQVGYMDSLSYLKFGFEGLQNDSTVIYFGSFINDSVSIKKSVHLTDNQACYSRMFAEIQNVLALKNYDDSLLKNNFNFLKYNIYSLAGNKRISFSGDNKKIRIVLLYSYSFGNYYNKFYNEVRQIQKENAGAVGLTIITMDPICYLK